MRSTSASCLLPLLIAAGLPLACSGSSEKIAQRGEQNEAGADGNEPSSGGSKTNGAGGEGGAADVSHAGKGNGGASTGSGGAAGGSAGASEAGAAGSAEGGVGSGSAGANAGGDAASGAGGNDGAVVDPPIDPSIDGASDAASGRYRLRYKPQQKCLVATPDALAAASCSNVTGQDFFLDGAGAGFVRVRSVNSGQCVGAGNDGVEPVVCNADAKLALKPAAGGYFQLVLPNLACVGTTGATLAPVKCSADTLWSLDQVGSNYALKATWSATSTFPGYSTDYAHDGDHDSGLEGHSWSNNWNPPGLVLPQEVDIDLGAKKQISSINVFTSLGYEIGTYDLDYYDGAAWVNLATVEGNTQLVLTHTFPTVVTQKLRFIVRRGPEAQFIYTRLNEVEIF